MIQEWVELDVELFKTIFYTYLNHEGNSEGKVIEIQYIPNIWEAEKSEDEVRIFLGSGLDPFEFQEANSAVCEMYERMCERFSKMGLEEEIKNDLKKLNVCYFQEGIPLISPIGATDTNIKLFLDTCFGDDEAISDNELYQTLRKLDKMVVWFVRNEDGKIVYDSSRKAVPDSKKLVRIRAIDLDDWKKMIYEGITLRCFPDRYKKGDVKREDIILLGG